MKEIREKKRLEIKQANSSKSQISETIFEIGLCFFVFIFMLMGIEEGREEKNISDWKTFLS